MPAYYSLPRIQLYVVYIEYLIEIDCSFYSTV